MQTNLLLELEQNSSYALQWIQVPAFTHEACKQSYGNENISGDIICAGDTKHQNDSWPGKPGGPLVCLNESRAILTGITSFGYEYDSARHYGIYARVTQILDWIQSNLVCIILKYLILLNFLMHLLLMSLLLRDPQVERL